jgi:hypothetical protein
MVKKKTKKTSSKKSPRYECGVCGLAVTVDNICGCIDTHNIICCGEAMKSKAKA